MDTTPASAATGAPTTDTLLSNSKRRAAAGGKKGKPKQDWARSRALFAAFYRGLGVFNDGPDGDAALAVLDSPLPAVFRVTGQSPSEQRYLAEQLAEMASALPPGTLAPLVWASDRRGDLVWQLSASRREMRSSPAFGALHGFVHREMCCGRVSRQESVSMIPVLLSGLVDAPRSFVLDMCAAPGSKTLQMLELVDPVAGFVIANDSNTARCHMLVNRVKRTGYAHFAVTNHRAQFFPSLAVPVVGADGSRAAVGAADAGTRGALRYDFVFCDVPCSGDGTTRKTPFVMRTWEPSGAAALHPLQVAIAMRGARLTRAGGTFVYSTCSLNPIENEAVVAELLRRVRGLELLDVSERLPLLRRREGLTSWRLMASNGLWMATPADRPSTYAGTYLNSMFAPAADEPFDVQLLRRCVRVMPHEQNTGGFFIAVFRKTVDLPLQVTAGELYAEHDDVAIQPTPSKRVLREVRLGRRELPPPVSARDDGRDQHAYDNQWLAVPSDDPVVLATLAYYAIPLEPTRQLCSALFTRSLDGLAQVVTAPAALASVLEQAVLGEQATGRRVLSVVNFGLELLNDIRSRQHDLGHVRRLTMHGAKALGPLTRARRVELAHAELVALFNPSAPFTAVELPVESTVFAPLVRETLTAMSFGPLVLVAPLADGTVVFLPGFRTDGAVSVWVTKEDREHWTVLLHGAAVLAAAAAAAATAAAARASAGSDDDDDDNDDDRDGGGAANDA